jgi:serine/threonine protein kinase
VVFKGKWKGVEVAVKRFIKQKLDERRMLEFRAEMAFLSELHHPNIVLFIGTPPPLEILPPPLALFNRFHCNANDCVLIIDVLIAWRKNMTQHTHTQGRA